MIFNCAFNDEGKVLVYNEGRKCELEMTGMISRLSVYMEGRDDMHYVIGDVHGCYTELMALLDKIESQDAEAQIIFVGDWVDRGSEQKQVLDWMMEYITEDGKYQSVRGIMMRTHGNGIRENMNHGENGIPSVRRNYRSHPIVIIISMKWFKTSISMT